MQVYVEYALIENFCMDFTLLYAAKAVTKNPCRVRRLIIPSLIGAAFAVAYPLFGTERLPPLWAKIAGVAIKVAAGLIMCALAGRFQSAKGYIKYASAFTAFTFLLGGMLIAVFSLTGINSASGGGYILSSVPIGIPLFAALALAVAAKKIFSKIRKSTSGDSCVCKVFVGNSSVKLAAFYDSGNRVYFGGSPVSIIPHSAANKLVDLKRIKTYTDIHTVSGNSKIAIFAADRVEIDDGKSVAIKTGVLFGVSPARIKRIVMHPDVAEVS